VIVVIGSRHDAVATDLVAQWHDAALCSAEDLMRPGWVWPSEPSDCAATWVVAGDAVPDSDVTGVFVRRTTVYPEELTGTHPDDRAYMAAEAHAFLVYLLSRTAATVVNPVADGGAFGEAALRAEHWTAIAQSRGIAAAPVTLCSAPSPEPDGDVELVEVVGDRVVAAPRGRTGERAVSICNGLGLLWAVVAFDELGRLTAITTRARPSALAVGHLERLLTGKLAA
jgi:hypothetical protein